MEKPYLVGITGGSGAGKTHFLNCLLETFSENEMCLISQDNYYKPREIQPLDENGIKNFDSTESIDFETFTTDIIALKEGKLVKKKEYTFNNPLVEPRTLEFKPAPIVVVEGIFVFHHLKISELLDLKIFIEAKDHVKLKRRIIRDNEERGYDLEDVLYRYEMHVAPTYEKYIKPYKDTSDLIIPNNQRLENALDVVITYLKSKI